MTEQKTFLQSVLIVDRSEQGGSPNIKGTPVTTVQITLNILDQDEPDNVMLSRLSKLVGQLCRFFDVKLEERKDKDTLNSELMDMLNATTEETIRKYLTGHTEELSIGIDPAYSGSDYTAFTGVEVKEEGNRITFSTMIKNNINIIKEGENREDLEKI